MEIIKPGMSAKKKILSINCVFSEFLVDDSEIAGTAVVEIAVDKNMQIVIKGII